MPCVKQGIVDFGSSEKLFQRFKNAILNFFNGT